MRIKISLIVPAVLTVALTACGTADTPPATPSDKSGAEASTEKPAVAPMPTTGSGKSGIPPKPTGAEREALLAAIKAVNPDAVRYEDKAIDAARNQCHAINGGGNKLDWSASQRFTYKDVVTTEEQGKALNEALKASGFCNT
ncbi:hypothetical protein [Streptomyces roseolus]|uniref:hypothetical protein n=1 Tax=Streptomyces roseolus TaxID=67358 RepID=UPI0036829D6B